MSATTVSLSFPGQNYSSTNKPQVATLKSDLSSVESAINNHASIILEVASILSLVYPVGSVYINAVNNTNPASIFGFGTWVAWGAGRVPVGYTSGDADFNAAEKTGGAKTHTLSSTEIPSHQHTYSGSTLGQSQSHTHSGTLASVNQDGTSGSVVREGDPVAGGNVSFSTGTANQDHTHAFSGTTSSVGSGGSHNNLQPYITAYLWKRTA